MKLRSKWEFGEAGECRRGLLCGMGISPEEQARPLIGVVNSWNEYNPGHVHLKGLAERVKQGIRDAGGYPVEVMTTAICDGMVLKDPKYIEVPSRNSIADQVEITVDGNFFDGMVMLSTCDSIVPGHLMAAARLDIPTVLVTGGYMPLGTFRGKEVLHIHAQDKVGTMQDGKIDPDEYNGLIEHSWGTCGGCTSMTTANSMCMVAEALGMSLPYNSTVSAVSSELALIAYRAGERVMDLLRKGITARKIITPAALRNAIKMDMAVAASSNLILHILSEAFTEEFKYRIINIHHGFLPAFKGAKPYHQAWHKGVKIIGATAHFATEDLDQGPIICQDIQRVPETASIDELVELGKDIEKRTLSAALKLWLEHRVFVYAGRTFIL